MSFQHELRRPGRGQRLTDAERRRLRELRGRKTLTDGERYERGALVARARAGGLEDQDLARTSGHGNKRRDQAATGQAVADAIGDALVDAIDRELDRDAARRRD
jgi:hypothetical protein